MTIQNVSYFVNTKYKKFSAIFPYHHLTAPPDITHDQLKISTINYFSIQF